jgi:hypothetical protein
MFLMPSANFSTSVAITHTADPVDTVERSAYTFSSVAIGDEAAGRKIVIETSGFSTGGPFNPSVSTITVGGESCTLIIGKNSSPGASYRAELWYIDKADDTTGDIVVTWSESTSGGAVGVWVVNNAAAGAPSDTDSDGNTVPLAGSLTVPANGGAICSAFNSNTSTVSWTGVDEDFDEVFRGSGIHSGASKIFATAQSPLAITATMSANAQDILCCAAFGPG